MALKEEQGLANWEIATAKKLVSEYRRKHRILDREEFEDLMKAGILDPTKVTRVALQNAASVAGLMITTECAIADKPEEKASNPMPIHPSSPGGGMY